MTKKKKKVIKVFEGYIYEYNKSFINNLKPVLLQRVFSQYSYFAFLSFS